MKKLVATTMIFTTLVMISCQREIDWKVNDGTDGDLLTKALQITPATNDTNTITFRYDANRRLIEYRSLGRVNGTATDIKYVLTRLADGKIKRIFAKTVITGGFLDSVVYEPYYSGAQLSYVIDTQFTSFGDIRDSTSYTYNGSGKVSEKRTFVDILGSMNPILKETYVYDASGNVITMTTYGPDGAGGYLLAATTAVTYNSRKSGVTLGEESFIIFPATNVSRNDINTQVVTAVGAGSYTSTMSLQQYNSFDRPKQQSVSITPQPPGYNLKLLYFYE